MARDNEGIFVIGIIALVLVGMYFIPAMDVFNLFVVIEEGYQLFPGESDTGLSNPISVGVIPDICNTQYMIGQGSLGSNYCSTTYWDMATSSVDPNCGAVKLINLGDKDVSILSTGAGGCSSSGSNWFVDVRFKQNLKGINFRVDTSFDVGAGSGRSTEYYIVDSFTNIHYPDGPFANPTKSFKIGSMVANSVAWSGVYPNIQNKGIELKPSVLNPNIVEVFFGGYKVGDVDVSTWDGVYLYVTGSQVKLTNPRFKAVYSCQYSSTDQLVIQPFGPNQQIDLFSTGFPVKQFCLDHPAIITDTAQGGSAATTEIYEKLVAGGSYTTTNTQTVSLIYLIDNAPGSCGKTAPARCIESTCDIANQFFDNSTNTCVPQSGITLVCPKGVGAYWDIDAGVCTTTPDISCPGSGIWNSTSNQCEYPYIDNCILPYKLNTTSGKCEGTGGNVITCDPPYNPVTISGITTCRYVPNVNQLCKPNTIQPDGTCELAIEGGCPYGYDQINTTSSYYCEFSMSQSCLNFGGTWNGTKCNIAPPIVYGLCTNDSQCSSGYKCIGGYCTSTQVIQNVTNVTNATISCGYVGSSCMNTRTINVTNATYPITYNGYECLENNNQCISRKIYVEPPVEQPWYEKWFPWWMIALIVVLFLLVNNSMILKTRRSFISIWLFKYRYGIFIGLMGAALLSYYYWNFGIWLLNYFDFMQPITNSGKFVAYLISIITGGLLGGIIYDILKKWRILR